MKHRQPAAAPTKKGKIWPLEEWKEALFDGEARRLQERFRKEASAARPRRAAESDANRRARFEREFSRAQEQLIEHGLRKAKLTAARRSASASSALDLLRGIRSQVASSGSISEAMTEAHRRAGHDPKCSPCEACGDVAQAILFAADGASLLVEGYQAAAIVDRAVEFVQRLDRGLARAIDAPPPHVNSVVEPVHQLSTAQVLANMGLLTQPPAEA